MKVEYSKRAVADLRKFLLTAVVPSVTAWRLPSRQAFTPLLNTLARRRRVHRGSSNDREYALCHSFVIPSESIIGFLETR